MSLRYVTFLKRGEKETMWEANIGKEICLEGTWYVIDSVSIEEDSISSVKLVSIEGERLEKLESDMNKSLEIKKKNFGAFLYELNDNNIDIAGIYPLQLGEQFTKVLKDEILDCFELERIQYPEKDKRRIYYDEKYDEFNFSEYKYLVKFYEKIPGGYKIIFHAYKNLNNIQYRNIGKENG